MRPRGSAYGRQSARQVARAIEDLDAILGRGRGEGLWIGRSTIVRPLDSGARPETVWRSCNVGPPPSSVPTAVVSAILMPERPDIFCQMTVERSAADCRRVDDPILQIRAARGQRKVVEDRLIWLALSSLRVQRRAWLRRVEQARAFGAAGVGNLGRINCELVYLQVD